MDSRCCFARPMKELFCGALDEGDAAAAACTELTAELSKGDVGLGFVLLLVVCER